jgi:peptidoglycan/LPS O-acetylase OafA/YrhL
MRRGAHSAGSTLPAHRRPVVRGRAISFGFVPALDGLRAISVIGVMLYHGGAPFMKGGFLTIDVFFVLSGFLITSLLLGEWAKRLTIVLGQFWARRARRLLPALLVMLLGVALFTKIFATPGEFADLRLDSLSTLLYVSNWHFIVGGGNYFALASQPSPLAHMWSLSIEEQFYIVWPLIVLAMLHLGRRLRPSRRLWPLLATAIVGAIASAVDMRLLYTGPSSVMRVYEGTDTRSQSVLVGAALAVGMAIWAQHRQVVRTVSPNALVPGRSGRAHPSTGLAGAIPPGNRRDLHRRRGRSSQKIDAWEIESPRGRGVLQVLGWAALLGAVFLWTHVSAPGAFLFRGGYFLVALGAAVMIFCSVTAQTGSLAQALGNPVFRYVGKISYGLYLWQLPIFFLFDSERCHLYGYPLLALRFGVTLVVATASFYLVEEPIRRGRMRSLTEWRAWIATSTACLGVVAVTVAATLPSTAGAAGTVGTTRSPHMAGVDYTGPPVRVAIFGDSVAWRLGFAMLASQPQSAYNVDIDNDAIIGCGVLRGSQYMAKGVPGPTASACNSSTPAAGQWPAQWEGDLQQFHPNVVVLLAGRWEVSDRQINGQWMHIGEPVFDRELKASLEQAVRVGTSNGALMLLMTSPCFDSGEQLDGQPWPEDSPTRLAEYNAMVRQVAAEHPNSVQLDDFGAQLCPGGMFTASFDGVQIRDGDGIHIVPTAAAGQWLDERVLPDVVRVGRLQLTGEQLIDGGVPRSPLRPSTTAQPGVRGI